jgi:hypothetical protein
MYRHAGEYMLVRARARAHPLSSFGSLSLSRPPSRPLPPTHPLTHSLSLSLRLRENAIVFALPRVSYATWIYIFPSLLPPFSFSLHFASTLLFLFLFVFFLESFFWPSFSFFFFPFSDPPSFTVHACKLHPSYFFFSHSF